MLQNKMLIGGLVAAFFSAQPAMAQMTDEELIDSAIAQANIAKDAGTMSKAKIALQRGANCLIGRDSGYFVLGAGGPCNARKNLTTSTTDKVKRDAITDAFNKMLGASGSGDLQRAQDNAEDAAALLEEAKGAE